MGAPSKKKKGFWTRLMNWLIQGNKKAAQKGVACRS
jgi:fatty-acid desaturase